MAFGRRFQFSFFHQFANGRRRKNTISFLNSDSGEIRGQKEITDHIVGFYKNLFGPSVDCSISLSDSFWPENLKLSDLDRDSLILPFQLEEVKGVVMCMRVNSALGQTALVWYFSKSVGMLFRETSWVCFRILRKAY